MIDPNLVILAGGISSRMKRVPPAADDLGAVLLDDALLKPKSLIGAGPGGRPLMDYLLYNAREAGYRDLVIVVGENDALFRQYYGAADRDNEFHGLKISYAVQRIPQGRTKPLGTADALFQALKLRADWRGTRFTVCNSDNLYSQRAFRSLLDSTTPGALIDYDRDALKFPQERIEQFAVLWKDVHGFLLDILEKPNAAQLASAADLNGRVGVSMNIFRFSYDLIYPILEVVPMHPDRQEKELPTAVRMLLKQDPHAVTTVPLSEYVPDLTHPHDILNVRDYLEREFPGFSFGGIGGDAGGASHGTTSSAT